MRYFKEANNSIKTAFITYALTLVCLLATTFLFFIGMMDIPLGILLGGVFCGTLSLVAGLLERKDEIEASAKYSIIMIAIRFVLLIAFTIIIALMYYRWDIKVFNVFSFIGAYLVSTIILIVTYLIYK